MGTMLRLSGAVVALMLWGAGGPIQAEDQPAVEQDELVVALMNVARRNLSSARLLDGSNVPPETEDELKTPLIPYEFAERIVNAGSRAAFAAWCAEEWERSSYFAFMKNERRKEIWSDKQLAYVGLLHGVTMGYMGDFYFGERGECSPDEAAEIRAVIDGYQYR